MKWTEMSAGQLHAAEQRFRVALGDQASEVFDRFRTDDKFVLLAADEIVSMMGEVAGKRLTSLNPRPSWLRPSWLRAREIMPANFWGVEEWIKFYGACFTRKQLRSITVFPWSDDILYSTCPLCGKIVRDCHFAFLGLDRLNREPLTILKLQDLHPANAQPSSGEFYSLGALFYQNKEFAILKL